MEDFEKVTWLTKGNFGEIYLAEKKGQKIVIKLIDITGFSNEQILEALNELEILKNSKNKFIIKYLGHFLSPQYSKF